MKTVTENTLVQAMQQPDFYDHPVGSVDLIETHTSWVFLAGDYAYKVKKPVNFGFLDYSTLTKRHHFCREELRLNRRFAPQLYLDIKTIGGDPSCPGLDGSPALEYAVKMKRFGQAQQLDRFLDNGHLDSQKMIRFATMIARFHHCAAVAEEESSYGSPQAIIEPVLENFRQMSSLLPAAEQDQLTELEEWSRAAHTELSKIMYDRKTSGFVRECHGDLHLANMAWIDGEPVLFDCIEFNENLRWIDVISDVAFLVMDLDDRGQEKLGWSFLNHYLQESGDYQSLQMLRFYQVYRAMVRAKVACLRLAQPGLSEAESQQDHDLYHSYLALASSFTAPSSRGLIITHGLSASGKSTFAEELASCCGAIHLKSDIERKRLYGLSATANSQSPLDAGIYSPRATEEAYERLLLLAKTANTTGYPVIIDATFLKKPQRRKMFQLAKELKAPLVILDFIVSEAELRRRIRQRATKSGEVSEANEAVLNLQLVEQHPLDASEQEAAIKITPETTAGEVVEQLVNLFNNAPLLIN